MVEPGHRVGAARLFEDAGVGVLEARGRERADPHHPVAVVGGLGLVEEPGGEAGLRELVEQFIGRRVLREAPRGRVGVQSEEREDPVAHVDLVALVEQEVDPRVAHEPIDDRVEVADRVLLPVFGRPAPLILLHGFTRHPDHLLPLFFHLLDEPDLRARAHEVVLGVGGREVGVALEVVGEEAHAAFEGHELGREGQQFRLERRHLLRDGADEAVGVCAVVVEAEVDLREVLLVLERGRCAEADRIAEVVEHRARHHGVEVDDRLRLAGLGVHEDVVELRVVVRDAQGQIALGQRIDEARVLRRPRGEELDLVVHAGRTADRVLFDRPFEGGVARGGAVEVGDHLDEFRCVEVGEELLEAPEGPPGVAEDFGALDPAVAHRVFDEQVDAEGFLGIGEEGLALAGRHEGEGLLAALAKVIRDEADVADESGRIGEDVRVHRLEDVAALARRHEEGRVDVPVPVGLDRDDLALEREPLSGPGQIVSTDAHHASPLSSFCIRFGVRVTPSPHHRSSQLDSPAPSETAMSIRASSCAPSAPPTRPDPRMRASCGSSESL